MIEWWIALALGLFGSFHCAGMCGPLVLALPHGRPGRWRQIVDGLGYHLGKALSYAMMGAVAGGVGAGVAMAGYQQVLSIVVGTLMLAAVLLPKRWTGRLFATPVSGRFYETFRGAFGKLMRWRSGMALGALGLINGFLPCGLVYVALGASMAAGDPMHSALFMLVFGAGTMPMLLAIFLARNLITISLRQKLMKALPYGFAVVSILLILRGLSLGIPYVSPKAPAAVSAGSECCH